MKTYCTIFNPINGPNLWPNAGISLHLSNFYKQTSMPKKSEKNKARRNQNGTKRKLERKRDVVTCNKCEQWYNARLCRVSQTKTNL